MYNSKLLLSEHKLSPDCTKSSESVWCIASLNGCTKDFNKATINYSKKETEDPSMVKTWVDFLYELGFVFDLEETTTDYLFKLDLSVYDSYTKIVTFLCISRAVVSYSSARCILQDFTELKQIFPELENIQLYQLAHYKDCTSYGLDTLHHPMCVPTSFITTEQFKERFTTCARLNSMFKGEREIKFSTIKSLLKDAKTNKEEILKLVLNG